MSQNQIVIQLRQRWIPIRTISSCQQKMQNTSDLCGVRRDLVITRLQPSPIAPSADVLKLIYIKLPIPIKGIWISADANVVLKPIIIFIGIGCFVEMNVTLAHNKLSSSCRQAHQILTRRDHSEETFLNITSGVWLTNEQSSPAALSWISKLCIRKLELKIRKQW